MGEEGEMREGREEREGGAVIEEKVVVIVVVVGEVVIEMLLLTMMVVVVVVGWCVDNHPQAQSKEAFDSSDSRARALTNE